MTFWLRRQVLSYVILMSWCMPLFAQQQQPTPTPVPANPLQTPIVSNAEPVDKCPGDMVEVDGEYCIERYEYPGEQEHMPAAGATWFDAVAYCTKRNRRACSGDEWVRACKGKQELAYPYGQNYQRGLCRAGMRLERGPAAVGSYEQCVSPYGVFDMSGNLWEWTGQTESTAAARGGSWKSGHEMCGCDSVIWQGTPLIRSADFGFRCCVSLSSKAEDEPSEAPAPMPNAATIEYTSPLTPVTAPETSE